MSNTYLPLGPVLCGAAILFTAFVIATLIAAVMHIQRNKLIHICYALEKERNEKSEAYIKAQRELLLLQRVCRKVVRAQETFSFAELSDAVMEIRKRIPVAEKQETPA